MKVTIHGPNLTDQSKGQFHVHTADCQDNRHYGPGRKHGGEEGSLTIDADVELDVSAAIYADHLSDYGLTEDDDAGRAQLEDWLSDFHFAPCVSFTTPAATPAPAARAKRPPLKRASYRAGVEWIALNDEPSTHEPENVSGYISTLLLADLFGQEPDQVAADVVRYRERNQR